MSGVGKHSGVPAEESAPPPRRRLVALAGGITVTLVAWGFLVALAINFGSQARDGKTFGWIFLGLATIGAAACLGVTLILGSRVSAALRGEAPAPPVPVGGRRASR
ncbi:MAG: hypothetical protein JWP74_2073 [Marmoricola sp.]|nr:hypothetical protein [Marmoricola sp.]